MAPRTRSILLCSTRYRHTAHLNSVQHSFLGLSLLSVILLFTRTLVYFVSCHITARSLHNQMFNALLRAPVFFFDSNPIGTKSTPLRTDSKITFLIAGRVVNRFSKDVSSIDEQLSDMTYNFVDVRTLKVATLRYSSSSVAYLGVLQHYFHRNLHCFYATIISHLDGARRLCHGASASSLHTGRSRYKTLGKSR